MKKKKKKHYKEERKRQTNPLLPSAKILLVDFEKL